MLRKWHAGIFIFTITFTFFMTIAQAEVINVDCDSSPAGAVSAALDTAQSGDDISVSGTCNDSLYINKSGITIVGNLSGSPATFAGSFTQDGITIDGANRVTIAGVTISGNIIGIASMGNAGFTLRDVTLDGNIIGVDVNNGSSAKFEGGVAINNSFVFGLEVINTSTVTLVDGANCDLNNNRVGAQISIGSSFFASTGSHVVANNNSSLGFSINTGSTAFFFGANLTGNGNGLDGVDVVSAANLQMDGESELVAENNGREGVSIDNSIVNLFGFFSTKPGFPRISSNNNASNGILLEKTSKLDIGQNASVSASSNAAAGVRLDDGSSATLQRAVLLNNNGRFPAEAGEKADPIKADIVASFASRISFDQDPNNNGEVTPNQVGLAVCDNTSMARGDVKCHR